MAGVMLPTPKVAFKEWAAVCAALRAGASSLILRKGGIAEPGGAFRVEHDRFWLYPTRFHAQTQGLTPGYARFQALADADRPPEGVVRLATVVEVEAVRFLATVEEALALEGLHGWSEETVRARFAYRRPGLFALSVRAWATDVVEVPERPEYAGCHSWVTLTDAIPAEVAATAAGEPRG